MSSKSQQHDNLIVDNLTNWLKEQLCQSRIFNIDSTHLFYDLEPVTS